MQKRYRLFKERKRDVYTFINIIYNMRYKCVKQYDTTDCAAACIATIALQYGNEIPLGLIREQAHTDRTGTSLKGIIEAASQHGFDATAVECEEVMNFENISLPCIAHVVLDNGFCHYIVLHKIEKNKILIADPSLGLKKISKKDFLNGNVCEQFHWDRILVLVEKNQQQWSENKRYATYKRMFSVLNEKKKEVFEIVVLSIIINIFNLSGIMYYKVLMDYVLPNRWMNTLIFLSLLYMSIGILKNCLSAFQTQKSLKLSKYINNKMALDFFRHILKLPLNFHETRKVGDIISRIEDITNIQEVIVSFILAIPVNTIFIISACSILFLLSKYIFLFIFFIYVGYVLVVVYFRKKYEEKNTLLARQDSNVLSMLVESLEGIEDIKMLLSKDTWEYKFKKQYQKLQELMYQLANTENFQYAYKMILNVIGEVGILGIGGYEVIKGNISMGDLIAINILVSYLMRPIQNIIDLQPKLHTANVSLKRIEAIQNIKVEKDGNIEISDIEDVRMNEVCFKYGTANDCLKDIDILLKKGMRIAIIGESGSGKTTLTKLLVNLYRATDGKVAVNSIDMENIKSESYHKLVSYVSSNGYIFSGSIRDNLIFDNKEISDEEIVKVIMMVHADKFINQLHNGLDTMLEQNGTNLSKGQKQRILLARALLKKPLILILDEATTNIDKNDERHIFRNLRENFPQMIQVIITHDFALLSECDLIYNLEKGRIRVVEREKE